MSNKEDQKALKAMYRRGLYMLLAIVASAALLLRPVFSFQEDKGIMYIRSFSMDQKTFYVTQTDIKTQAEQITATMSVKGLYYMNIAMLCGCVLCFLCFFNDRWRLALALLTAFCAGLYYIFMVYYALGMSSDHYATLYPNLMATLPAVVMQLMVMVRRNVINTIVAEDDEAKGDLED